jgi:hypothetical protein
MNTTDTGTIPLPTEGLQSEPPTASLQARRPMKHPATPVKALQMQKHHACTSEPTDILLSNKPCYFSYIPQQTK